MEPSAVAQLNPEPISASLIIFSLCFFVAICVFSWLINKVILQQQKIANLKNLLFKQANGIPEDPDDWTLRTGTHGG